MGSRLRIEVLPDYHLPRDVCSYGYFLLAPNGWDAQTQSLTRPLGFDGGIATFTITQTRGVGEPLSVGCDRALSRSELSEAKRQLVRMLRVDDDLTEFHRVDRRWKKSGRGRIFRSPTFWEDLVKTITSCNVTWSGTTGMNRRLCAQISPAFPTPAQIARRRPTTLRSRCGVGYRDVRLVELARMLVRREVEPEWFENPANDDEHVYKRLLELPGIGPYAAGNMLQLLGRYSRLAIDTESLRHGRNVLGFTGTDALVTRALRSHYERFGDHRFRSYWLEMWTLYEGKNGPAWTWAPKHSFAVD